MKYSDHQRVKKIYEYANKLNQYICENRWCRDLQDHNSTKANRNQNNAYQGHKVLAGIIFVTLSWCGN